MDGVRVRRRRGGCEVLMVLVVLEVERARGMW